MADEQGLPEPPGHTLPMPTDAQPAPPITQPEVSQPDVPQIPLGFVTKGAEEPSLTKLTELGLPPDQPPPDQAERR